jgi:hypothetical protein
LEVLVKYVFEIRAFRERRVAVVLFLAALLAALLPFSAAGAEAAHKRPLSYYSEHPCSLITKSETQSVFGQPMAAGQVLGHGAYGAQCSYSTTGSVSSDNVDFSITSGTLSSAKQAVKGPYTSEKSVGHHAFCAGNGNVYADAGELDGAPAELVVAASGCTTAMKLAKDAFAVIS